MRFTHEWDEDDDNDVADDDDDDDDDEVVTAVATAKVTITKMATPTVAATVLGSVRVALWRRLDW